MHEKFAPIPRHQTQNFVIKARHRMNSGSYMITTALHAIFIAVNFNYGKLDVIALCLFALLRCFAHQVIGTYSTQIAPSSNQYI
jgi:hypothetical protein